MFMSTRYKKKDPEWRKKSLFNVEDSLAKLLECLSVEYSVSKLISPKWKNFRSQKLKFESKTRINNAIWRCWHIQYKDSQRPRFFKFDMPFSDQTVHSTPQAVILEGKTWKKRLDIVSREYKRWRKFYNYKILKGGGEDTDNLKQQLSNENSEDEFVSDEEEDTNGKKHRLSPAKHADIKAQGSTQKLFESSDFMLDTYLADLPDTLFSSIRPAKSAADNALGLTYTDLSDMIQPTLDQLNPCFDDLLQNFDFLTYDWGHLPSNSHSIDSPAHNVQQPLQEIIDIQPVTDSLQQGLINTGDMYDEALASKGAYLYSSGDLYTPTPGVTMDNADEGLKLHVSHSLSKEEPGKRPLTGETDLAQSSPPRKMALKEVDSQFLNEEYLLKRQSGSAASSKDSSHVNVTKVKNDFSTRPSNFEALLSNAMDLSASQNADAEQKKSVESNASRNLLGSSVESRGISVDTVEEIISVERSSQISQQKMLVSQIATTKVVEYSELPPQLQAPNLTAHLQAVMSTRNANLGIPRNKSDTQLSSLADKFASPQSLKLQKKDASPMARSKQRGSALPRNMSDTNLVQMAKDTCRVYTRRRMSSISVDSKPLILPRNFSDSNLFALGRGMPRRPQPILPKQPIGIVQPTQPRVTVATSKIAISQVDAKTSQTGACLGQLSSFVVNKQQPLNADPVKVTLYMPKNKKTAQVSAIPKEVTESGVLPQRVEVIQYQGQGSGSEGSKIIGLVPGVGVTPTVSNQAPSQQYPVQSVVTHKDSGGTDMHTTYSVHNETFTSSSQKPSNRPSISSYRLQAVNSSIASSISVASVSNSVIQSSTAFDSSSSSNTGNTELPSVALQASLMPDIGRTNPEANSKKAESVAPLQGLSDQQLVSLAQILRGSQSGDIGQETTIAYLEMLQKQLNTLLEQRQGKAIEPSLEATCADPIGTETAVTIPSSRSSNIDIRTLPSSSVQSSVNLKGVHPLNFNPPVQKQNEIQIQIKKGNGSQISESSNLLRQNDDDGSVRAKAVASFETALEQNYQQNLATQFASSQLLVPRNTSMNASQVTSSQRPTLVQGGIKATFMQRDPMTSGPVINVVESTPQFPHYPSTSTQNTQQISIQHPVLVGLQSNPQLSTGISSMITLSVVPPINTNTVLVSQQGQHHRFNTTNPPNIIALPEAVDAEKQKTTGTSVRPTMVDLAIAASQRTYLTDDSSLLVCSSQGKPPISTESVTTYVQPTSVVSCLPQSIPTVVISDTSSDKSSENSEAKQRSRLRFQDREMYKEYRRKNHVTAEQKRRRLIKVAFDEIISLIPSLQEDRHGRTSKALVLQKAADYIDQLQRESELTKYKIEKIRQEVNRLNEEIKICQGKLPACGAISEQPNPRVAKSTYLEHVRQRISKDPKYWLFSIMLRPLFESFNKSTVTKTLQDFIHSVLKWFEDNCSLTVLRPAVIASLRQISTDTAILTNPSALHDQAMQAIRFQDPTILGQQQSFSIIDSSCQTQQATALPLTVSGRSITGAQNAVIVTSQPVRWAVQQQQQLQEEEVTQSRQSYITWSTHQQSNC